MKLILEITFSQIVVYSLRIREKHFVLVVDEAVTSGDPDMVSLCVKYRDFQRFERRRHAVANLLDKLRQTTDFYVEMKWEFHSWSNFLLSLVC